jgi:hypothetical protein
MSIVFFITAINFGLALGLLWVATRVWQWRRSLFRLNRSLQVAHYSLEQQFEQSLSLLTAGTPELLSDYQHLESQLEPKFQAFGGLVGGLQRLHRLWRVTMKKRRGF